MGTGDKYTDPALRDQVKQEIQDSDKGGAPGQWSARKAQFMASEYKKRGGGYTTDKQHGQDEAGQNLDKWGDEDWQTQDGSGQAKKDDGSRKRYLPKKAWEELDEGEKKATERKKEEGGKQGKQFVGNSKSAKEKRKQVSKEHDDDDDNDAQDDDKDGQDDDDKPPSTRAQRQPKAQTQQKPPKSQTQHKPPKPKQPTHGTRAAAQHAREHFADGAALDAAIGGDDTHDAAAEPASDDAFSDDGEADAPSDDDDAMAEAEAQRDDDVAAQEDAALEDEQEPAVDEDEDPTVDEDEEMTTPPRGTKRSSPADAHQSGSPDKKARRSADASRDDDKTIGSKKDKAGAPAPAGSAERLPAEGQQASWKALPGWVHGTVVAVVREDTTVRGVRAKGTKKDPRVVLEAESGKVCVHKPENCFFE